MEELLRSAVPVAPAREPARLLATAEERFIAISAALTGFEGVELLGTGMTPLYLATLEKWAGPNITAELLRFGTEPPPDDYTIRTRVISDPKLGPVATNVIELWYTGVWTSLPAGWYTSYASEIPNLPDLANLPQPKVVSGQAYVESLVWIAANTHPMGAKQPGYGTWAEPPKKGGAR